MLAVIFQREIKALLHSPSAWLLLALIQTLMAGVFLLQIETYMQLAPRLSVMEHPPGLIEIIVRPLYGNAAVVLLLLTPILTLGVGSEEKRGRAWVLLLAAPVTSRSIIGGKFLALWLWLGTGCLLMSLMPAALMLAGTLDIGAWLANLLALLLLVAAFCALSLAMSSRFRHPISASLASFAVLLGLWLIDGWNQTLDRPQPLIDYLAMPGHFQRLQTGLIDSLDLSYFLLFIGGFLSSAARALTRRTLHP